MFNQYILEAKYLDKIGRVKKKTIVGVYKDLESIEPVKEKLISDAKSFDIFDSYNFASYVSPPQNGTISGAKYVRIVYTGTDYNSYNNEDLTTIKKAYEIYYVRDNCFQYMQFNCYFEGGFNRAVESSFSNITNGTAFQDTFGTFGNNPPNTGGPQTGGSYVIRSDLNGDNWQFFPNMHLVL